MAATFDNTLPTAKDRMRYALGDIDVDAVALEQDETYLAAFAQFGETLGTAVMAEGLAARYGQRPTSISDDTGSISWGDRVKTWIAVANRYRAGGATSSQTGAGAMQLSRTGDEDDEYSRTTVLTAVVGWTG